MKVESTKNGNVKIVLSPEQAMDLYVLLNFSEALEYPEYANADKDAIEATSYEIHDRLMDLGLSYRD